MGSLINEILMMMWCFFNVEHIQIFLKPSPLHFSIADSINRAFDISFDKAAAIPLQIGYWR